MAARTPGFGSARQESRMTRGEFLQPDRPTCADRILPPADRDGASAIGTGRARSGRGERDRDGASASAVWAGHGRVRSGRGNGERGLDGASASAVWTGHGRVRSRRGSGERGLDGAWSGAVGLRRQGEPSTVSLRGSDVCGNSGSGTRMRTETGWERFLRVPRPEFPKRGRGRTAERSGTECGGRWQCTNRALALPGQGEGRATTGRGKREDVARREAGAGGGCAAR